MTEIALPLTGGCGCGAVRFEVTEPLRFASYCHCTRCQRRTGTAASVNAALVPGSFRFVSGEGDVRSWAPDGGWEKGFCGRCGSALFSREPGRPVGSVRLGSLDRDPGIRPAFHQFVAYAASWAPLPDDGLPRYAESRSETPKHDPDDDHREAGEEQDGPGSPVRRGTAG
jgi:hypothetical protein